MQSKSKITWVVQIDNFYLTRKGYRVNWISLAAHYETWAEAMDEGRKASDIFLIHAVDGDRVLSWEEMIAESYNGSMQRSERCHVGSNPASAA